MPEFIRSIPAAASSPYAFAAYAIAAILFIFAGARLRMAKLLLAKISLIPEVERRRALEIATGTVLPTHVSPEQWIRQSRLRWTFLLLGALLIALLAVATIALLNPTKAQIEEIKQTTKDTASDTQGVIAQTTDKLGAKIDASTKQITGTVEDSALATLETMFPLAVRQERDVDGTIMHLRGQPRERVVSYDHNMAPMELHWGDRFCYSASRQDGGQFWPTTGLFLEIQNGGSSRRFPLPLDYGEQEIRIPGSSPMPFAAYLVNEAGISDVDLKITVYSADRERGREDFKTALMNTALNSAARRVYFEVSGDGVRLRSEEGQVLRSLAKGTYVKIMERSADESSCRVRLPEGREGWVRCELLRPIAS